MWHVAYSARPTHQGQAVGFVVRAELPNDEQCAALFAALAELGQPTWSLAMRLARRCGARWGELVALRPLDILFEPHRSVHIRRALEQSGRGLVFKAPKNAQARATIFPTSLAADLRAHVDQVSRARGEEGLLFPGTDGGPAGRRPFLRVWHRAARRAGCPYTPPPGRSGIPTTYATSPPAGCCSTSAWTQRWPPACSATTTPPSPCPAT